MANANTDPSMEEILASIRRIIAEDDEDAPGAPVAPGDEDADGPAMSAVPPGAGGQVGASEDAGGVFDAVTAAAGVAVEERVASAFDTLAADVARRDVAGDAGASDARTARAAPENSTAYGVESRHQTRQSDQSVASDETGTIVAGQFADVGATKEPSMISDTSAAAATKAFQSLSENVRTSAADARTLEEIVVDMLNPMVKEWLDANLPGIVEEKVEDEIRRVARRARP